MAVSARNSKKVFVLGTKEILIMVCVDLSRLRRGKMHNKAEKLDMFNKYCCSLFVRRRCDIQPWCRVAPGSPRVLSGVKGGSALQLLRWVLLAGDPRGGFNLFSPPVRLGYSENIPETLANDVVVPA